MNICYSIMIYAPTSCDSGKFYLFDKLQDKKDQTVYDQQMSLGQSEHVLSFMLFH